MRPIKSFWLIVFILNALVLVVSGVAIGQAIPSAPRPIRDPQTGKIHLLKFDAGALGMPLRDARATAQAVSAEMIGRYASVFGAAPNSGFDYLRENAVDTTAAGTIAVRYRQTISGIPVYAGQLVVNVRADGAPTLMSGDVSAAENLTLTPVLSAPAAGQSALNYVALRYGVPVESLVVEDGGLWVYDPALVKPAASQIDRAGLVWKVMVSSRVGQPIRVEALIDAADASPRFSFNRIHASPQYGDWHSAQETGLTFGEGLIGPAAANTLGLPTGQRVGGSPDMATYTANNGTSLPGTFLCDEGDTLCTDGSDDDADSAHTHARGTYNFYWNTHGLDSLDGAGMQLRSTVHYSSAYCNAFWNGTQMAYGDGCNIVIDDVVAHELTHGVTEFSSNLIYAYDSGAINESFSDVWGEFYDLSNGTAEDTPANRWVIGEEIQSGGFRNMKDPTLRSDPDRVGSPIFWTDARDNGGVHVNSGINNKAAYLMADGGTFNGQTITGIGMVKPLHIYYYVQTMLATESTTYNELGQYINAACDELVGGSAGITADDCAQVAKVVLATEMALPSPHLPDSVDVCDSGSPVDAFFDNFEDGTTSAANWTTSVLSGSGNAWTVSSTQFPLIGTRSMRADNIGGFAMGPVSWSVSAMTNGVVVPANAYLHFHHMYAWEYDGWDGGVVQYSTDGGTTWTTFSNGLIEGEQYPGRATAESSVPFANQFAYTGDSFGAGSSRINLSSLVGQTVKIRFYAASDEGYSYGDPDGWWIDDVRIYSCAPETGTDLLTNGGFETGPARPPQGWVVKNKVGTPNNDRRACNKIGKPAVANTGECAFRFTGGTPENTTLTQTVDLSGVTLAQGDQLVLSGYERNTKLSKLNAKLIVNYTGAPSAYTNLSLNSAAVGYQSFELPALEIGSGTVSSVVVRFTFKSSSTNVKHFLDDLSLIHTPATNADVNIWR